MWRTPSLLLVASCVGALLKDRPTLRVPRGGATAVVRYANRGVGLAGFTSALLLEAVPEWGLQKTKTRIDAETIALFRDNVGGLVGMCLFAMTARDEKSLLNALLVSLLAYSFGAVRRWHRKKSRQSKSDIVVSSVLGALFLAAKFDTLVGAKVALAAAAAVAGYYFLIVAFNPTSYLEADQTTVDAHTTFLARRSAPGLLACLTLCLGGLDPYLSYEKLAFRAAFLSIATLLALSKITAPPYEPSSHQP